MKNYWLKIQLTAALGIALLGIITYSPTLWITPVSATPIKFSPPPPPPDRSAVGNRGAAGSRGCGISNQSLTALVPEYKETLSQGQAKAVSITKVWGLTTNEHPTFWFFVPYNKSTIDNIEFVLKDESSKPTQTLYKKAVTIPEVPGIISVDLPATNSPLQVGKIYHWFLKMRVICNLQQPAQQEYRENVEGWVQRVNLNPKLADSFKQATPKERAKLYAENGIWYNALTTLAELRLAKPQDPTLATDWINLLKSVGLEPFLK